MHESILSPRFEARGARLAERPYGTVVLTFGDVPAEYRAGVEGAALFDETDRGLVRVRGGEAGAFLHRLLANEVRGLEPGSGNANLLLSSKGKVLHGFELAARAEDYALSTEPGDAAELVKALDTYHFTEDVELLDATGEHAPLALCGPRAGAVLGAVLGAELELADHARREVLWSGRTVAVTALDVAGSPGLRADAGPDGAEALWDALVEEGAAPAGLAARDILRVEAGRAAFGVDVTPDVYPQEAGLEGAFSLDKGCYIGQEVVAKIDTYGGLNKRLLTLSVSHDDPVPAGTELALADDDEVRRLGVVTSWAYSFALDTGLVLAYVKRKHQEPGTRFRLDDGRGEAVVVAAPVRPTAE